MDAYERLSEQDRALGDFYVRNFRSRLSDLKTDEEVYTFMLGVARRKLADRYRESMLKEDWDLADMWFRSYNVGLRSRVRSRVIQRSSS